MRLNSMNMYPTYSHMFWLHCQKPSFYIWWRHYYIFLIALLCEHVRVPDRVPLELCRCYCTCTCSMCMVDVSYVCPMSAWSAQHCACYLPRSLRTDFALSDSVSSAVHAATYATLKPPAVCGSRLHWLLLLSKIRLTRLLTINLPLITGW